MNLPSLAMVSFESSAENTGEHFPGFSPLIPNRETQQHYHAQASHKSNHSITKRSSCLIPPYTIQGVLKTVCFPEGRILPYSEVPVKRNWGSLSISPSVLCDSATQCYLRTTTEQSLVRISSRWLEPDSQNQVLDYCSL